MSTGGYPATKFKFHITPSKGKNYLILRKISTFWLKINTWDWYLLLKICMSRTQISTHLHSSQKPGLYIMVQLTSFIIHSELMVTSSLGVVHTMTELRLWRTNSWVKHETTELLGFNSGFLDEPPKYPQNFTGLRQNLSWDVPLIHQICIYQLKLHLLDYNFRFQRPILLGLVL